MYENIFLNYVCRLSGADLGVSNRGGAKDVDAAHILSAKREVPQLAVGIQGPLEALARDLSVRYVEAF